MGVDTFCPPTVFARPVQLVLKLARAVEMGAGKGRGVILPLVVMGGASAPERTSSRAGLAVRESVGRRTR